MIEHSRKLASRAWLLGALLLLTAASALSQTRLAAAAPANTGADPAINSRFYDADAGVWAGRFEGESREIYRQRAPIVAASGISMGMAVADVGAGTGLFTMLFARQVGAGGRVVAVDISPSPILTSIHRALKPGGRFVVIDFERIPGVSPASRLKHVRAGKETVMEEVRAAGFRLRQEVTGVGLTDNYYLIFEKP